MRGRALGVLNHGQLFTPRPSPLAFFSQRRLQAHGAALFHGFAGRRAAVDRSRSTRLRRAIDVPESRVGATARLRVPIPPGRTCDECVLGRIVGAQRRRVFSVSVNCPLNDPLPLNFDVTNGEFLNESSRSNCEVLLNESSSLAIAKSRRRSTPSQTRRTWRTTAVNAV